MDQSCLSSSDAQVVSGSEDGRICFWDLVEAKIVHTLEKAHKSVVYSITYHPTEICLLLLYKTWQKLLFSLKICTGLSLVFEVRGALKKVACDCSPSVASCLFFCHY